MRAAKVPELKARASEQKLQASPATVGRDERCCEKQAKTDRKTIYLEQFFLFFVFYSEVFIGEFCRNPAPRSAFYVSGFQ